MRQITALLVVAAFAATPSFAQNSDWWLGVELGAPTGVTVLKQRPNAPDIEVVAAWDLDDFLFLNGHVRLGDGISLGDDVSWFWGPGLFLGVRDRPGDSDAVFGASFRVGVQVDWPRFASYVHLTPAMELIPETDFGLGGGIGLRMRL